MNKIRCPPCMRKRQWLSGLSAAIQHTDWDFIDDDTLTVDNIFDRFSNTFDQLLRRFIPVREYLLRPRDKRWMISEIRTAIRNVIAFISNA